MNRPPRLAAILPLKVLVGTVEQPHFAHTVDISRSGARIVMHIALVPGCDIVLEYKKKRVRAEVVWSKSMKKGSSDYLVGIRVLDDGQRFWQVDFAPTARILESLGRSDSERSTKTSGGQSAV